MVARLVVADEEAGISLPVSLLRTLGFAGLYVVATYAGRLTVMDDTNLSLVWPAAGVSAVWFLAQRTSRWRWLDVAALSAVTMIVNTMTGAPPLLAAIFAVANLLQAFVFVGLFRRWLPHLWGGGGELPLGRLPELWRLMAAAFLSTASGALVGPTGVWLVNGAYSVPAAAVWLTRNTVSILLIGAAGLRLGHLLHQFLHHRACRGWAELRAAWSASHPWRWFEYLAVVVVSAISYVVAFALTHGLPLAFPLLVMTVWAGLRLHTGFVILHDLMFGSAAVLFTLYGLGPFAMIASHPVRALVAQLFVGMIAVVGLALALGRDERAALLADLTAEREAAAGQAKLMSAIVDSMSEGLTVIDEQGRFLLRNPASRALLGGVVSSSGGLAKPGYYGLFHLDGTPLSPEEMPYRRALNEGTMQETDILVRNAGVPDGRILSVSCTVLPPEGNGTRCAVTVFRDVTAERRHRDDLASFAGVVAHDLLNPLATIDGWTSLLTDAFADAPEHPAAAQAADGVAKIKRASTRMYDLINGLLAYTTVRDAAIDTVDIDLTAIVTDLAAARIDHAQSNRAPVPQFQVDELHPVHADPVLVRQLLDNLIGNAVKYTAADVAPQIGVSTAVTGGLVTVSVTDNGIGIPNGQHEHIFDNFHRAHRAAAYAGTGLGLGICRRIVERHGGTITAAENPTGRGSRFAFTLPVDSTAVAAGKADEPPARRRSDAVTGSTAPARPGNDGGDQDAAATPPVVPSAGFEHAARVVLDYLHDQLPLAFWAVTRVQNGRQVYLYLDADNGYGLRQGESNPWDDSFCVHMAAGRAPAVAPDAQAVPAYAQASVNTAVDIGAYAGAVISEPDGTLFGAICGLDPQNHAGDSRLVTAEPLLALLGRLLTAALAADRAQDRTARALLLEQLTAETDPLTGLPNRRAWQRLIEQARTRYERLADPTVVAMLDLDNLKTVNDTRGHAAGDAYIAAAATAVRRAIRDSDTIARLGGDEFGLLLPDCTDADADTVINRIYVELDAAGVAGSIGWAPITVQHGFPGALAQADTAMYATKQQRRQHA